MNDPLVLAIDTTGEFGSLALTRGKDTVQQREIHSTDGFGHLLFGAIGELLLAGGVALNEVGLFAAAAGPGSFTGVRVGLAAAKGLAAAAGRPAAGVSNLMAMAAMATGDLRAVVLDARRGEVYAGMFDSELAAIGEPYVGPLHQWLGAVPADAMFVLTTPGPFSEILAERQCVYTGRALAAAVGYLAPRFAADPALIDAQYVRKSDAELFWKDK